MFSKNNKKIKFLSCNKVELSKHKMRCVAKYLLFEQTNGWNILRPFGTCRVRAVSERVPASAAPRWH